MSAQRQYENGYGCSCHLNAPCSFCTEMTEEEANVYTNGGMNALIEYWKNQDPTKE